MRARFRNRTRAGIVVAVGGRYTAIACAALGGLLLGCGAAPTYVCSSNTQCGADGTCEANGGCSFPDADCPSGRRFGEFAPSGNACVPQPGNDASSSASSSSTTSTEPVQETLEPGTTTTSDAGSTSSGSEPVATTAGSTADSTSTSSGESSTGAPPSNDFFDDFQRPNADDVGNGWIEKTPESFAVIDGGIRRVGSTGLYPDNLVYRPEGDWLDTEATVEFSWLDLSVNFGSPQCGLRIQMEDIQTAGSLTGYLLFVHGSTGNLMLSRQIAGSFTQEYTAEITPPFEVGTSYRFRFRVTGSDPVILDGYLEQLVAGVWTLHSEVHGMDDAAERITTPGTFAVGGHVETEFWEYESVALEFLDD